MKDKYLLLLIIEYTGFFKIYVRAFLNVLDVYFNVFEFFFQYMYWTKEINLIFLRKGNLR